MNIRHLLLLAPLCLMACAGALVSSKQTSAASGALAKLEIVSQSAQLGAFSTPRSFDIAAPYYAEAIAGFRRAKPGGDDAARADERAAIEQAMDNCIESIELTAKLHRTSGLTDNPDDFFVLPTCQSAARSLGRSL